MPQRARLGMGYLPQEPSVFRHLTVRDNLELALDQTTLSPLERRERRDQLIDDFHLTAFMDRRGFQLSGGERRRCEVARALAVGANGPRYLLLDEPFAGVDAATEQAILDVLREMKHEGRTIVVVHHDLQTVPSSFDEVILLNMRVVAAGPVADVFDAENLRKTYGGRLTMLAEAAEAVAQTERL